MLDYLHMNFLGGNKCNGTKYKKELFYQVKRGFIQDSK